METPLLQLKDGIRSIYLAGRIAPLDWRHTVVQGLRDDVWSWQDGSPFPVLERAIYGRYDYVGPFWPFLDSAPEGHHIPGGYFYALLGRLDEEKYMSYCRDAIMRADLVAGYFDECPDNGMSDNWLTASQLVFAFSLGKKILSITQYPFDTYFVEMILGEGPLHRQSPPRISLGRQLGLTDAEIDKDAGCGFVYFIEAVATRHIKIGWSKDPVRRKKDFQTGSPTGLETLGTIPGSRALEHKLQKDFDQYHDQGDGGQEWFYGVKALRDFIESNVLHPDDK